MSGVRERCVVVCVCVWVCVGVCCVSVFECVCLCLCGGGAAGPQDLTQVCVSVCECHIVITLALAVGFNSSATVVGIPPKTLEGESLLATVAEQFGVQAYAESIMGKSGPQIYFLGPVNSGSRMIFWELILSCLQPFHTQQETDQTLCPSTRHMLAPFGKSRSQHTAKS